LIFLDFPLPSAIQRQETITMAKEIQEIGQWKVGMLVIDNGNAGCPERIMKIDRITDGRNGTIHIGNTAFDINGRQRGGDAWSMHISPATDEDIHRVKGSVAKRRLGSFNWDSITGDQALQLEQVLMSAGIDIRKKKG
jgi:hypothetical protein